MKKALFVYVLCVFAAAAQAQDYHTGIGLRGGSSSGITVKHFISDKAAIEGIFSSRWGGANLTGLYEISKGLGSVAGLNWYYGAGAHVGRWYGDRSPWFKDKEHHIVLGADAIIGLEYNFKEIPINLSIDYKPAFNLIGYSGFWGDEGALSIRYLIR